MDKRREYKDGGVRFDTANLSNIESQKSASVWLFLLALVVISTLAFAGFVFVTFAPTPETLSISDAKFVPEVSAERELDIAIDQVIRARLLRLRNTSKSPHTFQFEEAHFLPDSTLCVIYKIDDGLGKLATEKISINVSGDVTQFAKFCNTKQVRSRSVIHLTS